RGAPDGQIIDCPVNRQLADIAARKEQGANDERIGSECEARNGGLRMADFRFEVKRRLVFECRQHATIECGQKQPLNELGGKPATAAMAQQYVVVPRLWQGTGK